MVLGFRGDVSMIDFLMSEAERLENEYPDESFDQGPTLAVQELAVRFLNWVFEIAYLWLLSSKNKVQFFDDISSHSFANWRLKTITGITVKQNEYQEDEIESEIDDKDTTGTLAGISKAVLNGSGLRSNEFVQKSLEQGYYISSMKYRYICTQESGEFIISISSKDQNLRVDIEKSYSEEDGNLFVLPFPKEQQNEIIRSFQQTANQHYNQLLEGQKKSQDK